MVSTILILISLKREKKLLTGYGMCTEGAQRGLHLHCCCMNAERSLSAYYMRCKGGNLEVIWAGFTAR